MMGHREKGWGEAQSSQGNGVPVGASQGLCLREVSKGDGT